MLTIIRTSRTVACEDAGAGLERKLDAQQRCLRRSAGDQSAMMRGGMERLSARRYRPGAVHRTGAELSSRPVVAMIGKRRVAANLFAAVHTVSHVASPVTSRLMVTWS